MENYEQELEDDIFSTPPSNEPIETDPPVIEDDDIFGHEPVKDNEPTNSLINDILAARGITDGKISILDESGAEDVVDFFSLSKEEQLDIINGEQPETAPSDVDLDDSEIDLINNIRKNNQSVSEYLEEYKNQILSEYQEQSGQQYSIDAFSDQELYALDLRNKGFSDDEIVKYLEIEKQNEELFNKKVSILRTEYKELEDKYNEAQKEEFERQQQQEYDEFSQTMTDIAVNTPEFYGIELEDSEKNEVLSFLLDIDENGTSEFQKSLNDPNKLYEAAWFLRYGKESFDVLRNAYEAEIARLKKDAKPSVIHKPKDKNQFGDSIYGLY